MRGIIKAAASAGVLAAVLAAGCSAAPPAPRPTVDTCFAFGVRAIRLHVKVTRVPRACAGLSHEQVNQAIVRAVREVVGTQPKTAARRLAAADSRYLGDLVSTIRPPRPTPPFAAPPGKPSGLWLNLVALAAWIATAAAGAYLLSGWPPGTGLRRRGNQTTSVPHAVIVGHVGLAAAGLATWIGFLATAVPALAWAAVGMIVTIAGLGMATLITGIPEPGMGSSAGRAPVLIIATHGVLATATILLVMLAAIGAG